MKKTVIVLTAAAMLAAMTQISFAGSCCDKHKKDGTCAMESGSGAKKSTKASDTTKDPTKQDVVIDPVCGMDVETASSKYASDYEGKTYHFCNSSCKKAFDKAPGKYIKKTK